MCPERTWNARNMTHIYHKEEFKEIKKELCAMFRLLGQMSDIRSPDIHKRWGDVWESPWSGTPAHHHHHGDFTPENQENSYLVTKWRLIAVCKSEFINIIPFISISSTHACFFFWMCLYCHYEAETISALSTAAHGIREGKNTWQMKCDSSLDCRDKKSQ